MTNDTTAHVIRAVRKSGRLLGFAVVNPDGKIVAKFRREQNAARDAVARDRLAAALAATPAATIYRDRATAAATAARIEGATVAPLADGWAITRDGLFLGQTGWKAA